MSVPTWAGFVTYLPDDEVATGDEIGVYGGRNVALAMSEIFASLGCSRISDPDYGGEMGWDFRFRYGGRHSFWCRVQSFHPIYWLLLEGPGRNGEVPAHLELWRKFAGVLEQDSRFDQVIWRPFKEGPPDWDEFTLSDDLPPRRVLEELPARPAKPRPKAAGSPLTPRIVGAWFVLLVGVLFFIDNNVHGTKAQTEFTSLAIAGLLIGLAVALLMSDRLRKRESQSPDEAVRRIPPEPTPEQYRPLRRAQASATHGRYAFLAAMAVAYSIPFALAFAFCAMLVYLGAWWAIFGTIAVALIYWSFLGRSLWGLVRPIGSKVRGRFPALVVGIWSAVGFVVVPVVAGAVHDPKARLEATAAAFAALAISLAAVLWIVRRRRTS
ncbi:hypothetical protein [Phenylobacterium sp.]|jgi:hypothetical protein|uniref:hypothetical protein n=1 Tax=Phenylobacterium sp. TaxID=1871053 RepID=UPI002F3F0145